MATSLSTMLTDLGYLIGMTISTSTNPSTTSASAHLNASLKKVVGDLLLGRCWEPLGLLTKEAEYTMDGSTEWYSLYTLLGSSDDYYAFVGGTMGDYPLHVVTIEEEAKTKVIGEYAPSTSVPYMLFWTYDATNNMPKVGFRPYTSTATVYLRYLRKPPTMDTSTPVNSCLPEYCDPAILYYAAFLSWSGYREVTERQMWTQMYQAEIEKLRANFSHPTAEDGPYHAVM